MERVAKMSKEDLCDYLNTKGLDPEAIDTVKKNRLSGATFLELSKEHLKELFPIVGDRIAVSTLLESLKMSSTRAGADNSNVRNNKYFCCYTWTDCNLFNSACTIDGQC